MNNSITSFKIAKTILILLMLLSWTTSRCQNVGIGTTTPTAKLDVESTTDNFITRFNGANQMYIGLYEAANPRGYLGSFSGNSEDFDMGTMTGNLNGKMHFTIKTQPKMTIDNFGSVGIGTTTPSSSSILDINSTAKGILIPRMTSSQRIGITTPVNGLMVYDITTNSFWYYNGSVWANMTSNNTLNLPFDQTANTTVPAFKITNFGLGAALTGASSSQIGIGIQAHATGEFGWGLNAFTDKAGAISIRSIADNGQPYYGEITSTTNSNTLMYLLNKGLGKTSNLLLSNASSMASNLYIAGNHLGKQVEIYQTNTLNTSPAVYISNEGTGLGLKVESNNASAISGACTNNIAVRGDATTGTGLLGYSTSGTGLNASSISGTGIYANSLSGLALDVNGKIKISGGNTNPTQGAVLTSDANGNATWQQWQQPTPKIAFKAIGVSTTETNGSPNNEMPFDEFKKVEFQAESYDTQNNFIPTGNSVSTSSSSTFTIPVNGIYHLNAAVLAEDNIIFNHLQLEARLILKRGSNVSTIAHVKIEPHTEGGETVSLSTDVSLLTGDIVWLEFSQINSVTYSSINLTTISFQNYFSGHLVFIP